MWTFINLLNIPQQLNSYDCGMFVCYGRSLAKSSIPGWPTNNAKGQTNW